MTKDNLQKEKSTKKEEVDHILSKLEKSQLEDEKLSEGKVEAEAEDLDPSGFTSGTDNPSDQGKNPIPEDESMKSKRFSKKHESIVDEAPESEDENASSGL